MAKILMTTMVARSPCGRGHNGVANKFEWVRGPFHGNIPPHPSLRVAGPKLPSPAAEVGFIRLRPIFKLPELGQARVRVGEGTITGITSPDSRRGFHRVADR